MSFKRITNCWYHKVCNREHSCDACPRFIEMSFLMDNSKIPKSQQISRELVPSEKDKKQFEQLEKIKTSIDRFVERGQSVYIASQNTGNAKTSWAIKLMLNYFDKIWPGNGLQVRGLFIHVPTFLTELKDFANPIPIEFKEHLKTCDLVIWDDIAFSKMTEYEISQILILIDSRAINEKSNIFTSNIVNKNDVAYRVGDRITSRIFSKETMMVIFTSDDGRNRSF